MESEALFDLANELYLYQHVYDFTSQGASGSSLVDFVFSNDESRVSNLRLCPPLCGSDHSVIIFDYKVIPLYVKHFKVMYMYNKTNEADVFEVVEKWKPMFSLNDSIENLWKI